MKSNSASPWALQTQNQCLSLVSRRVTLEGAKLGKGEGEGASSALLWLQ